MTDTRQPTESDYVSSPYKGPLGEEIPALRDLLGYTDYVECSTTFANPTSRKGTRLPDSQTKDILLVAIGLDVPRLYYTQWAPLDMRVHIGVSIIDTRQI